MVYFNFFATAQSRDSTIKSIEGIWIQEDFKKSFDITRSITKSKNVFAPELPVGLRINTNEVTDSILNIGYSVLHDHSRHPEVSRFFIQEKDTVYEQGSLLLDLRTNKGQMSFNIGYIPYFNAENTSSYFSIKRTKSKTILCLVNESFDTLKFVRFKRGIAKENPFPNPLYNYTLSRTLTGNYKLFNPDQKLISQNIIIKDNGDIIGFKDFEKKKIYYSTDIYCGMPISHDVAVICEYPTTDYMYNVLVCQAYIIKRSNNGDVVLYNYNWNDDIAFHFEKQKKVKYILRKK